MTTQASLMITEHYLKVNSSMDVLVVSEFVTMREKNYITTFPQEDRILNKTSIIFTNVLCGKQQMHSLLNDRRHYGTTVVAPHISQSTTTLPYRSLHFLRQTETMGSAKRFSCLYFESKLFLPMFPALFKTL